MPGNKSKLRIQPIYLYYSAILGACFVLLFRLFYLQILHQSEFNLKSDKNRIREVSLKPLRGLIYDRNGTLLVNNRPAFTLYGLPYYLRKKPEILENIAAITGSDKETLQKKLRRDFQGYFRPVRLLRQVDFSSVSRLEERLMDFPGVDFWVEPIRYYPSGVRAAHLFGYLGEISSDELENEFKGIYSHGDIIGKKGIERYYETLLHGKDGVRYVEVDALGRIVRNLERSGNQEPIPGYNLYLTIDSDLQLLAERQMEGQRGSIIMMDLRDAGILTMVSKPDYDPGLLSGIIRPDVWDQLMNDESHPLYDRSVQSTYPAGSVFKLLVALAAIDNQTIDPDWTVSCPGYFRLGRRTYKCWNAKGHGRVNLYHAIEQSCNVYFYQLGLKVGIDKLAEYGKKFAFGEKTGIDLPLENAGILPDRNFMDKRYGKGKWTKGFIVSLSVGQGDLLVTPLQLLRYVAAIATKGVLFRPHLLGYAQNPVTNDVVQSRVDSVRIQNVSDFAYDVVREGMRLVVNGEHGTGKAARVPGVVVAGKTGTAQNPHGKDHAWFIGFAPFDKPEVAIVVLVENGGGGGAVAAPKAGALLRLFFDKKNQKQPVAQLVGKH